MKNCEMDLNGNILTITVDISKEFGVSSSKKSIYKSILALLKKLKSSYINVNMML